ncbi:hypothetical protein [Falsarthrobacter nasiphocae]
MQKLENECARKAGIPHEARPFTFDLSSLTGEVGLFGNPEMAAKRGYEETVDRRTSPETMRLTPAQEKVIMGDQNPDKMAVVNTPSGAQIATPKDGCAAKSRIAVYGSIENSLKVNNFPNEILAAGAGARDGVKNVIDEISPDYSKCMNDSGYALGPGKAGEFAKQRWGVYRAQGQVPSVEEAALAKADAGCQAQSGLINKLQENFFDHAGAWAQDNEGEILKLAEIRAESKKRAQAILSGK